MALTEDDVRGMAAYARIDLDSQELATMTTELNGILATLQPIREMDLEGVPPTFHPIGELSNVMREDLPAAEFSQGQALSNAACTQDGSFLLPSILGLSADE